jgi:hypothetical protein
MIRCKCRGYKNVSWNCWKIGTGGKGVRESIQKDWTDQSKAHPLRAYNETHLWMSTQNINNENKD